MSEESHSEDVQLLTDYVGKIGHEVGTVRVLDLPNGEEQEMIICFAGGDTRYQIFEAPDAEYYEISFEHSLLEKVATSLDDETIKEYTGEELGEDVELISLSPDTINDEDGELIIGREKEEDPPEIETASQMLESIDKEVNDRFIFNLFQESSHPEVSTTINTTSGGYFAGINISRKIFPQDSGFSLTEFNRSVQSVLSIGTFAQNVVVESLNPDMSFADSNGTD